MLPDVMSVLREHPFVADFESTYVERLAALARQVEFEADQVIFHEGDDYSVFYLLIGGMVALELETSGGAHRVQTLYAGDEFDWSALLPHAGKHFQARALEPVQALAFEGVELLAAFKADPAFGMAFMLKLLGQAGAQQRRFDFGEHAFIEASRGKVLAE